MNPFASSRPVLSSRFRSVKGAIPMGWNWSSLVLLLVLVVVLDFGQFFETEVSAIHHAGAAPCPPRSAAWAAVRGCAGAHFPFVIGQPEGLPEGSRRSPRGSGAATSGQRRNRSLAPQRGARHFRYRLPVVVPPLPPNDHRLPSANPFGLATPSGREQSDAELERFQELCSRRRQSAQTALVRNLMARTDVRGYGII